MDDLVGKVAVVTGAASGIGLSLVKRFAAEGMSVVVADIEEPKLKEVVAALQTDGARAIGVVTDVSSAESVEALRDAAIAEFGGVDVLCNNAGVAGGGTVAETSLQTWAWTLGVNLWGVIHGLHYFVPAMIERGSGHVVNTASIAGHLSSPSMGPYNASKHAVVTISETMQQEMLAADTGVGVSVLCPGFVATNILFSERNRPESMMDAKAFIDGDDDDGSLAAIADIYKTQLSPDIVAGQVVDAIKDGTLYVFTDDKFVDAIRERHDNIHLRRTPGYMAGLAEKLFE